MEKIMTVDELLQMAREDIARNRLSSAERSLEQAILCNNQQPEAFYLLGQVYSKRGKLKKAMVAFEKTLKLDPLHTEASIALSSLYSDVGRYQDGADVYRKAKTRLERVAPGFDPKINRQLADQHAELGKLYQRYERFEEAYAEFVKALKLEPGEVAYTIEMAKCLAKTGDREKAVEILTKLLESQPKCTQAKVQLGIIYHSAKQFKDAYQQWQEALLFEPDNKSAQMYLSMIENDPALLDNASADLS